MGVAPTRAARAQQAGLIQMRVEAGFDGRFREGRWTPLLIRVSNSGPGLTGELRVQSGGTLRLASGGYSTPIDLPNQSSKQIFLYVSIEAFTQQIQVDLVETDGALMTSAVAPLSRVSPNDLLVGIVTESPAGSVDFSAIRTNGTALQANLALDSIPPLAQAMESLDVLYFNDVDTGRLALDRRRAIDDWALSGGHLVVGGGPNWQKTRAGFDALLPVDAGATVTLNSLDSLAAYVGTGDDKPRAVNVIAAQGAVRAGPSTRVLVEQDSAPLVIRRGYGLGTVDYITIDPSLEPLRSWTQTRNLWGALFGKVSPQPGWSDGVTDASAAIRAINYVRGLRLPDAVQLAGFLLIYVILIGPLNYLILRRLHHPEWAWGTIPAIILVTSVAAYLVGSNLRGTLPTVSRMNLVQQWSGQDRARLDGIVGVLAPRRSVYSVVGGEGVAMRVLNSDNAPTMTIQEGARYAAPNIAVDSGISANFLTSAIIQPLAISGSATLSFGAQGTLMVEGEIRNDSPQTLTDAIVFCVNSPVTLGSVAPGERRPFKFTATIPQLGIPSFVSGPSTVAALYSRTYGSYRFSREMTAADLLVSANAGQRPETALDQVEERRRSFLAAAMTSDLERGTGRGFSVYFVGWADASPVEVNLRDTAANTEDLTVYVVKLPTRRPAITETVTLPPGLTLWTPLTRSTFGDYAPYNLYLIGGNEAVFQFAPHPEFQLRSVTSFSVTASQNGNASGGLLALWDHRAGKWVDLATQARSTQDYTFDDPADVARFVGNDGAVRVQVRAPSTAVSYDSLEVTFNGTLDS